MPIAGEISTPVTNYGLTYAGAIELRSQLAQTNRKTANFIGEVKSFKTFAKGLASVHENSTYDYEWSGGTAMQIANYAERKKQCVSGSSYPASRLFATLPGQAFDLECEMTSNGSPSLKQHFVYLQQFGLAVQMSSASAS